MFKLSEDMLESTIQEFPGLDTSSLKSEEWYVTRPDTDDLVKIGHKITLSDGSQHGNIVSVPLQVLVEFMSRFNG